MRLFTALDLTPEVANALRDLLELLQPAARLRWSRPENLHLTLKFIGEWPEEKLDDLRRALAAVAVQPVDVKLAGLGFFPNARAPRVFWVGIDAPPEMAALAARIDRAIEPLGIAPEKRPYSPHLTLARIQEHTALNRLHEAIRSLPSTDFGAFVADRFYLYQSRLTPIGSIYTKIGEFGGRG